MLYLSTPFDLTSPNDDIRYARAVSALVLAEGTPCVHPGLFTQQIIDIEGGDLAEVQQQTHRALLRACTCMVVWTDFGVSSSMQGEISVASTMGKEIEWRTMREVGLHMTEVEPTAWPVPTLSPAYTFAAPRKRLDALSLSRMQEVMQSCEHDADLISWLDAALFKGT